MTSTLYSSSSSGHWLQSCHSLTVFAPCHSYPTGAEVGIALVLICIPLKGVEHVVRFIDHLWVFNGKIPIQIPSPFWEWEDCPFIIDL